MQLEAWTPVHGASVAAALHLRAMLGRLTLAALVAAAALFTSTAQAAIIQERGPLRSGTNGIALGSVKRAALALASRAVTLQIAQVGDCARLPLATEPDDARLDHDATPGRDAAGPTRGEHPANPGAATNPRAGELAASDAA